MKERISYLTFVEQTFFSPNNAYTRAMYKCHCGVVKEINMRKVREKRTISCGCKNHLGNGSRTHGLTAHILYKVWKGIKSRCYNKNSKYYERYGGSGITMCDEWINNPEVFIKWAIDNGWQKGLEIDKDIIPKELGISKDVYSPQMCKIVTRKQNCNARRTNVLLSYKGETKNIQEWSVILNISPSLIRIRVVKLNWSVEKALSTLPNKKITGRLRKL
jgi:hypothetical protein